MAQQTKHQTYLVSKRAKASGKQACVWMADRAYPKLAELRPYQYEPYRYRRSFLVRQPPIDGAESEVPRRVFCLWTGANPLSDNRQRNLERLRETLGVPVVFITPETMHEWVLPGHPIHPAYEHLSMVHRSDYLRAYLMHHHGGGYADIKEPLGNWGGSFDRLESQPDKWVLGFRELGTASVTRAPGHLGRDLRRYYHQLVGNSSFIARSHTPFTAEWLREVERRLDYYQAQASEFPGGERGAVVGYPVSWTRLLGRVFHPLSLKYMDRLIIDDRVKLVFKDYQ